MVPDFAHLGFTAEIPLPNQGFPARFLALAEADGTLSSDHRENPYPNLQEVLTDVVVAHQGGMPANQAALYAFGVRDDTVAVAIVVPDVGTADDVRASLSQRDIYVPPNLEGSDYVAVMLPVLINDNKSCRPVASPKNVTETLALGIRSGQRQHQQSTGCRRAGVGRSINEILGHDAAPLFHPALHGSQLRRGGAPFRCSRARGAESTDGRQLRSQS